MSMFCYQCEQTAKGTGCTAGGVCGKDPETAALQDLLVFAAKSLAQYAHRLRGLGASDREADVFILEALFSTVTNVDFDPARLEQMLKEAREIGCRLKARYEQACRQAGAEPETLYREDSLLAETREAMREQAQTLHPHRPVPARIRAAQRLADAG